MTTAQDAQARLASLMAAGRLEEAEALARVQLQDQPGNIVWLGALCLSLIGQTEFSQALLVAQEGIARTHDDLPGRHTFLREFMVCCAQLGQIDLGREMATAWSGAYRTSHGSDRAWPGIHLWILGLNREAMASHEAQLADMPDNDYLVHQIGMNRMCMGDLQGMAQFRRYTSRAYWDLYYRDPALDSSRLWTGEPIRGKSILIRPHGGVGDYIQFIRYARILREQGAKDVVAVLPSERLRGLLQSVPDIRIGSVEDIHSVDCWTTVFGLCCNLFLDHGPLPVQRYLTPPPSPLAEAQLALIRRRAAGRRCIGIAWHSDMADGSLRSLPLGTLLPLFGLPNVHWVITQRGVARRQFVRAGLGAQCSVIGETSTFDDTAALFAGLDGVVTIDSYSLHLAGALGVPTWFLAGRALDWRHFNEETHSAWYPSVRLVRQPAMGDWRGAVQELQRQLQVL